MKSGGGFVEERLAIIEPSVCQRALVADPRSRSVVTVEGRGRRVRVVCGCGGGDRGRRGSYRAGDVNVDEAVRRVLVAGLCNGRRVLLQRVQRSSILASLH